MPVVFRQDGFRFHFFSNEGDPREPVHIHVVRADVDAKFWLFHEVEVAYNRGFNARISDTCTGSSPRVATRSWRRGMTISARATAVRFDEDQMWVELEDGRTLGIPLIWFPRLLNASPSERSGVSISPSGLHWEGLDEDISIAGLLAGRGDMTRVRRQAA